MKKIFILAVYVLSIQASYAQSSRTVCEQNWQGQLECRTSGTGTYSNYEDSPAYRPPSTTVCERNWQGQIECTTR